MYYFTRLDHNDDMFQNVFWENRFIKIKSNRRLSYCGPQDYPWKNNTKCCFFTEIGNENKGPIVALPQEWLVEYDSTIPIYMEGYFSNTRCYLDLEKQGWAISLTYLIRDKYHLYKDHKNNTHEKIKPYSTRKGDEEWCITYLNIQLPPMLSPYFRSFLLMKNINFSEFDAKIKAEGLECPVPYDKGIKLKDSPNFRIIDCFHKKKEEKRCICVNCRKDYRAMEVGVDVYNNNALLYLLLPIN